MSVNFLLIAFAGLVLGCGTPAIQAKEPAENKTGILKRNATDNIPRSALNQDVYAFAFIKGGKGQIGESEKLLARCDKAGVSRDICADKFTMRSVEVLLPDYWIGETEVTYGSYDECVKANVCAPISECPELPEFEESSRVNLPATCVSWFQARRFCEWVGGDLPTEAEWEYAAKCINNECLDEPWALEKDPITNDKPRGPAFVKTKQFRSKRPNLWGMWGNVSEWVLNGGWVDAGHFVCPHNCRKVDMRSILNTEQNVTSLVKGGYWGNSRPFPGLLYRRTSMEKSRGYAHVGFRCVKKTHDCGEYCCPKM